MLLPSSDTWGEVSLLRHHPHSGGGGGSAFLEPRPPQIRSGPEHRGENTVSVVVISSCHSVRDRAHHRYILRHFLSDGRRPGSSVGSGREDGSAGGRNVGEDGVQAAHWRCWFSFIIMWTVIGESFRDSSVVQLTSFYPFSTATEEEDTTGGDGLSCEHFGLLCSTKMLSNVVSV